MFGIFTHAQLDRGRFWDSFSQQLQHQGPDYIQRCTFRNKPLTIGDNVILPAVFPPLSHQVQDVPQTMFVKVREEDMKNVSEVAGQRVSHIDQLHVHQIHSMLVYALPQCCDPSNGSQIM